MLQPKRGGRIEAAGLALGVIEDLLLDVAERHARLGGGVGGLHAVDEVERRKTQLAERQLARFDDGACRPCIINRSIVQRILLPSPSSLKAQKLSIGSALERTRAGRADPSWRVHVGAAHQEQQAVRQRRARAGVFVTSSSGGGASPCAIAAACWRCARCCRAPSGRPFPR